MKKMMVEKEYRYKKGGRMSSVKCPFCGIKNVWASSWEDSDRCGCRINEYCMEYPAILPEGEYTRVFVFEKAVVK